MQYDFYKLLGVGYQASSEEIKHAYYEKAKKYHPDVNQDEGAEQVFKLLNEAYQTLIHPQRRKKYDLHLRYGSLIEFNKTAATARPARSPQYEEYIRRRKQEAQEANRAYRWLFKVLNGMLFWIMVLILGSGLVFSIIDAIMNYDFIMLMIMSWFFVLFFFSYWFIKRRNKTKNDS